MRCCPVCCEDWCLTMSDILDDGINVSVNKKKSEKNPKNSSVKSKETTAEPAGVGAEVTPEEDS